jgi:hypothetical protein
MGPTSLALWLSWQTLLLCLYLYLLTGSRGVAVTKKYVFIVKYISD